MNHIQMKYSDLEKIMSILENTGQENCLIRQESNGIGMTTEMVIEDTTYQNFDCTITFRISGFEEW
jgi:hypothetical protein